MVNTGKDKLKVSSSEVSVSTITKVVEACRKCPSYTPRYSGYTAHAFTFGVTVGYESPGGISGIYTYIDLINKKSCGYFSKGFILYFQPVINSLRELLRAYSMN